MENNKFSETELQELVWSLPISAIAKQFNLSGYEIRKVCKKLGIPVPIKGYWQKIKADKKLKIKPLDTDYVRTDGISVIEQFGKLNDL